MTNRASKGYLILAIACLLFIRTSPAQNRAQSLTPDNAKKLAGLLEKDWKQKPEWAEMLTAILAGESMGANSGWYKPSQKRLDWKWFAAQFDKNKDAKISREEGSDFAKVFAAIDQNGDGGITAVDFNWDKVSHVGPTKPSEAIFFLLDRDSNGRVDQKEIMQWMGSMDQNGKGYVTPDDFTKTMAMLDTFANRPAPNQNQSGKSAAKKRAPGGQDPNRMMNMLFGGELGSFSEGPKIGDDAPDFDLQQLKSSKRVQLSNFFGKKIVILNFGSFT